MKKSLLAVAAIGAFASAAQAQSSVTVYGILDMGYYGSTAASKTAAGVETKTTSSSFRSGQESTSRLGFKGNEDLGGGSSAFFTVEMALRPDSASLTGNSKTGGAVAAYDSQTSGSAVDNRQSFVGLKKNGVGSFSLGRQYTLGYEMQSAMSATQNTIMPGNVLYAVGGTANSGGDSDMSQNVRASNALIARTETIAGFRGNAMYAMSNANVTNTGAVGTGTMNWSGWGLSADYTWQKLVIGATYQSFKTQYANGVAASAEAFNAGLTPNQTATIAAGTTAAFPATMLSDKQTQVLGTYDFGILKAFAGWQGRKVQDDYSATTAAATQVNRNAQAIGVRSYITPTIEAWGTVGNGKYKATVASTYANFTGWQVGSNYYLSKRTNLYAIYGSQTTTSNNVNGAASNAAYSVGVRHTF